MRSTTSPKIGQNNEYPIPAKEEALNSRNYGGNTIPNFPPDKSVIPAKGKFPRNTEGVKSKYPLQTSRPGERRI